MGRSSYVFGWALKHFVRPCHFFCALKGSWPSHPCEALRWGHYQNSVCILPLAATLSRHLILVMPPSITLTYYILCTSSESPFQNKKMSRNKGWVESRWGLPNAGARMASDLWQGEEHDISIDSLCDGSEVGPVVGIIIYHNTTSIAWYLLDCCCRIVRWCH